MCRVHHLFICNDFRDFWRVDHFGPSGFGFRFGFGSLYIESRAQFKVLGYKLEVQGFWLPFKDEGMRVTVVAEGLKKHGPQLLF